MSGPLLTDASRPRKFGAPGWRKLAPKPGLQRDTILYIYTVFHDAARVGFAGPSGGDRRQKCAPLGAAASVVPLGRERFKAARSGVGDVKRRYRARLARRNGVVTGAHFLTVDA